MKACPFCAEEIQDAAIVCKHCHADLVKGVPAGSPQTIIIESKKLSPGVAALLSFIIPGAGQMYCGRVGQGLAWFFFTVIGYVAFILPGLCLHLVAIVSAASLATSENNKATADASRPGDRPRLPDVPPVPTNQPMTWKPFWWAVAGIGVVFVVVALANRQADRAASTPALVVTIRPTPTGWRVTNDSSLKRENCTLSILGHGVIIASLPAKTAADIPATSFSGGGSPPAAKVAKPDVSMSCRLPSQQDASIYLLQ